MLFLIRYWFFLNLITSQYHKAFMASQYEHQAMYTSTEQTIRKGDIFGRGSPALVVALCSSRYKCSDKNRMTWRRSSMALCLPFRPQPLNCELLRFVLCLWKLRWWILIFLISHILSLSCTKNYLFKFKFCPTVLLRVFLKESMVCKQNAGFR